MIFKFKQFINEEWKYFEIRPSTVIVTETLFSSNEIYQYSGLHDSENTEIYNGDILRFSRRGLPDTYEYKLVVFEKGVFKFFHDNPLYYYTDHIGKEDNDLDFIVVGNIETSPDLSLMALQF